MEEHGHLFYILLLPLIIGGGIGLSLLQEGCGRKKAISGRASEIRETHIVRHADGREALLVVNYSDGGRNVGGRWWRLDVINPATGRRTAREVL